MAFNKAKALQEAHKYVTQGKNALAIRQYLSILEHDPSDLILLNTIGDLYIRENNLPEGLKHFYKLAEAYVEEGYVVKAIAIYKKIAKIDHNTAEPFLKLSELYLTQGHAREARERSTDAFEFYRRTNQQEPALEVLRKLAQMDSDNTRRWLHLAQYAESAGKVEQAAEAYLEAAGVAKRHGDAMTAESALHRAAELSPDNPELKLFRAQEATEPSLESSATRRTGDAAVDLAAELAANLGDLQEPASRPLTAGPTDGLNSTPQTADDASAELGALLDELQEGNAVENFRNDPQTHYNLGVAFLEMGLHDEAIGEFQRVVKGADLDHLSPNFLQACTLLAASFTEKGMPSIAAQWYSRALKIPGLDEDAVLALRYDLGVALERAGEPKSALEKFTQVYGQNIDYRDVAEKIRTLREKTA